MGEIKLGVRGGWRLESIRVEGCFQACKGRRPKTRAKPSPKMAALTAFLWGVVLMALLGLSSRVHRQKTKQKNRQLGGKPKIEEGAVMGHQADLNPFCEGMGLSEKMRRLDALPTRRRKPAGSQAQRRPMPGLDGQDALQTMEPKDKTTSPLR